MLYLTTKTDKCQNPFFYIDIYELSYKYELYLIQIENDDGFGGFTEETQGNEGEEVNEEPSV